MKGLLSTGPTPSSLQYTLTTSHTRLHGGLSFERTVALLSQTSDELDLSKPNCMHRAAKSCLCRPGQTSNSRGGKGTRGRNVGQFGKFMDFKTFRICSIKIIE